MDIQPENHFPTEIIYNLLCICRKKPAVPSRSLRSELTKRGLIFGSLQRTPRLSFWIRLCQAASLLDDGAPAFPTIFAQDWLAMPLTDQIRHLVNAWVNTPARMESVQMRRRLLSRLLENQPPGEREKIELGGLKALSIYDGSHLTSLGMSVLAGSTGEFQDAAPGSWVISGQKLFVPYPPDWSLLWELEMYLEPIKPGVFLLNSETLKKAAQVDAQQPSLLAILQRGVGAALPRELEQALEIRSTVKLLVGPVLEFSDPDCLARLRKSAIWRKELEHQLSPRHVQLDAWHSPSLLRRMHRRGLINRWDLENYLLHSYLPGIPGSDHSSKMGQAERVFLLYLLLLSEGLGLHYAAPPGVFLRLAGPLNETLRAAAAKRAAKSINTILPKTPWVLDEEAPDSPSEVLVEYLREAIERQQAIDVLYRPGQHSQYEYRHLSPLLVEKRRLRWYLLAYCHTRCANRIFRLDRLKLLDEPIER